METVVVGFLQDQVDKLRNKANELNEAKVKIAISGQSGSGKSSMINAIFGEKKAKVGSTETTLEAKCYTHNGTDFYDLPGCGTSNFPKESYIKKFDLLSFDAFIIVTANRFYENDLWLINEMLKAGRPVYVVRSKMDEAVINEKRDNNLAAAEVYQMARNNISQSLKTSPVEGIYLISSVEGVKADFDKLLSAIENNLSAIKKKRFLLDILPYNRRVLDEKRKIAEDIILYSASASAANGGLNLIPGLDIAADIGILLNLAKQIQSAFGLDEDQVRYASHGDRTKEEAVKQFVLKFATKEGIILLLKRFGTAYLVKEGGKWVPILGQLLAAGISYKMTSSYGKELLEEAYELARGILENSGKKISDVFNEERIRQ